MSCQHPAAASLLLLSMAGWAGWAGTASAQTTTPGQAATASPAPASSATKAIYDEKADAAADIQRALVRAQAERKAVLVVFGANWCGDCRMLDTSFTSGAVAPLIAQRYVVVKVEVGRFDRNVHIASNYRVPLRAGIPAVAVLSAEGQLLHATRGGEIADARRMGDRGIHDFFAKLADPTGR